MVECNYKGCTNDAPVRMSDCGNKYYIYLCREHQAERRQEMLDIDRYQRWENMGG